MHPRERSLGKVFLVGAGPGDPGLITLRGAACLAAADLVLHDYLVNPELLRHAPESAERVDLGHPHGGRSVRQGEINRRMIEAARAGKNVVRLKCGDPFLFGRGTEEVEALEAAGIPYETVPGVTSASAASAAAASAGVALTHRKSASSVTFITGHRRDGVDPDPDYLALAQTPGTLVFYMGITTARRWSEALLRGGRRPDTPVAIVRRASWPDQETFRCTLGDVADRIERDAIRAPAIIVVGPGVATTTQTSTSSQASTSQASASDLPAAVDDHGGVDTCPVGVILMAHGSLHEKTNRKFETTAARIASQLPDRPIVPAFLTGDGPRVPEQVAALAAAGVRRVLILPYFLHTGRHVTTTLPEIVATCRGQFPDVAVELLPSLEDSPLLEEWLVQTLRARCGIRVLSD